jgi:hypothetical protein
LGRGAWCGFFDEKQVISRRIIGGFLVLAACSSAGCLGPPDSSHCNLSGQDSAFLDASNSLPMGNWAADVPAESVRDYQKMYEIAKTQKEFYEKRMQVLSPMPVSDGFQGMKDEYRLADEYGLKACVNEMNVAQALRESNVTGVDYYWNLENQEMDASLSHLYNAKRMVVKKYGSGGFPDTLLFG